MRVALIADSLKTSTGGPSVILKETKNALEKKGLNIKIITNDIFKDRKISLSEIIRQTDICHLYGGWTYFHIKTFLLALNFKKKIIIHPLGYYEPWSLKQKKLKKKIAWHLYQKKILVQSNMIHCASTQEEKNLLKLNKNFCTKVMPYGITNNSIKKKINSKKLQKKAIYFSRIHKKKGVENLIEAWKKVNDKNWILDICGPADSKKYLNKLIINAKKNTKINFLKPIYSNKKKFKLFDNYDFLILPTYSENFGMIILESLARGLPVLTTANVPWMDIKKKNAGWITKASSASLVLILKKIFKYSKKDFYIKSKNAINLAKRFSWNNISKLYVKTYYKLLNE